MDILRSLHGAGELQIGWFLDIKGSTHVGYRTRQIEQQILCGRDTRAGQARNGGDSGYGCAARADADCREKQFRIVSEIEASRRREADFRSSFERVFAFRPAQCIGVRINRARLTASLSRLNKVV